MAFNFGSFLGSASGALGPVAGPIVGGLVGGLFGGSGLPPELRRLYRFQLQVAKQLRNFSESVPLSDPQEQLALAQQRGMLGEEQRQTREGLFASGAQNQTTNQPDMLAGLGSMEVGQRSSLTSAHLLNALQARRSALTQSAQVAQGAVGAASGQQPGLGDMVGNLAQLISYNQHRKKNPPNTNPLATLSTVVPGLSRNGHDYRNYPAMGTDYNV